MQLPRFAQGHDPGPSFLDLLKQSGLSPFSSPSSEVDVPHGTTCLALKFADGVLIAGDRRATAGNIIRSRHMDKVVEADRYSGVAFSGAAGPSMEMIKLFQLQLEHYEKM